MNRTSILIIILALILTACLAWIALRATTIINNDTGSEIYEEQNRALLKKLQLGDVVVCTQYYPALLPSPKRVVVIGYVLKIYQGWIMNYIATPIKMNLVDKSSERDRFLSFEDFNHCEVRIVTNKTEQRFLIGSALIDGLNSPSMTVQKY